MSSLSILLIDEFSISEKIILKSFKILEKAKLSKIFFIGDEKKFKKIKRITLNKNKFEFINIKHNKNFELSYINEVTKKGIDLFKEKKIKYLINMPINKKKFLKNKYFGFTEFFSKKFDNKKNHNMLMYSENFSVVPLTTHIELKDVDKQISFKNIKDSINNIATFNIKCLKNRNLQIVVLGINPHASIDLGIKNKDHSILKKAVKFFRKKNLNIVGPISADTAFKNLKNKIFLGMYHDQVLIPFKLLNGFKGINITIGKELIRLSPDHGTGTDLIKKNIKSISNISFIECIKFCEKYG